MKINNYKLQQKQQSGYTLVEIAITFTALLIVIGGMAWPFAQQIRNDEYNRTIDYMEIIKLAVVKYAATNLSSGGPLVYELGTAGCQPATNNCQEFHTFMPGGRPYLPCPDLDGDGIEDRKNSPRTGAIDPYTYIRAQKYNRTTTPVAPPVINVDLRFLNGRCADNKGLLPYKTLGTKPADPWGNYYNYWVDGNFSHRLFGFDQETKASRIFKYAIYPPSAHISNLEAIEGHYYYATHLTFRSNDWKGKMRDGSGSGESPFLPAVILERDLTRPCTSPINCFFNRIAGVPLLGLAPTIDKRTLIDGREVLLEEYGSVIGRSTTDMANGVAFVILSTGANGNGATKFSTTNETSFNCIPIGDSAEEIINAGRTHRCTDKRIDLTNCRTSTTNFPSKCTGGSSNHRFVYNKGRHDDNDDIVAWMHPNQLIFELHKLNILPVDIPPVVEFIYE